MSVPKSKRKESSYDVVDTAKKLRGKVLHICLKLPRRYTYILLQDAMHNASKVAYLCKGANSVFPTNAHEAQIRIDYWIHARAALQALSMDIDDFADIPSLVTYNDAGKKKGATRYEIDEIGILIKQEMGFLKKAIETDRKRFGKMQ